MSHPSSEPLTLASEEKSTHDLLHDRRALGLIGLAVVAVGALGYFVVLPMVSSSSSGGDSGLVSSAHHTHPVRAAVPTGASAAPAVAATAAPPLEVRDPFSPLIVPVTAAASVSTTPTAQATTQAVAPPKTIVIQQPGPTVTDTAPATAKYTLVLQGVSLVGKTGSAVILLNGVRTTVPLGGEFPSATNGPFQLNQVQAPNIASFSYGDSSFAMQDGETQTEN